MRPGANDLVSSDSFISPRRLEDRLSSLFRVMYVGGRIGSSSSSNYSIGRMSFRTDGQVRGVVYGDDFSSASSIRSIVWHNNVLYSLRQETIATVTVDNNGLPTAISAYQQILGIDDDILGSASVNGVMYISDDRTPSRIYSLNPISRQAILIGSQGSTISSHALSGYNGTLYSMRTGSSMIRLYSINVNTGTAILVASVPSSGSVTSMEIVDGRCYVSGIGKLVVFSILDPTDAVTVFLGTAIGGMAYRA